MASLDERVAYLEGRVEEHGLMVNGIREAMVSLEARIDSRLQTFEARVDQRFASVDQRFAGIDHRLDAIDGKLTRYFTWLAGLYVTGLIAALAVLAALVAR